MYSLFRGECILEINSKSVVRSINTIEKMLISFLRVGICGGELDETISENINEENLVKLYNLAHEHDLAHIVADVLFKKKLMPDYEIKDIYRANLMMSLVRYQNLSIELEKICTLLEENQIPHIPLKGAVIRKYYPEPWLRTSGDIDILIKPEDLEKAGNLIINNLKYTRHGVSSHDWCLLSEDKIIVELHYSLIEHSKLSKNRERHTWKSDCLENIWENATLAENKDYRYNMSNELFYFYHIAHMAKHFEIGGCGIRTFLDLWLLNTKFDYNREEEEKILETSGLLKFEKCVTQLSQVWFSNGSYDETVRFMENYILPSGVFGNVENKVVVQQLKRGGKFKFVLTKVFMPYNNLKSYYPILQKHKWLTPIFQVHRWCRLLSLSGVKYYADEIKANYSVDNYKAEITKEMLKKIGL